MVIFRHFLIFILLSASLSVSATQTTDSFLLIKADHLFDGEQMHTGWGIWVQGQKIVAVGPLSGLPTHSPYKTFDLKGKTLLPGLIEGHSHLLLHPYNETKWDKQVMDESDAERVARAVVHARSTLMAGFTTVRDLGTEGAGYADVGLKTAIEKGIIPGPRMLIATRAIVATGSYGPKLGNLNHQVIKGAAEADGVEGLTKEIRQQMGNGADLIKVYADYRWGPDNTPAPTFTLEELRKAVEVSASAGKQVVAHASNIEGMKRAALARVSTIEHGDYGNHEVFDLMLRNNVALCATLGATEATATYDGWKKGIMPPTDRIAAKKKSFQLALQKSVTICFGGDVGVFTHGDNVREMELMVEYGMKPVDVIKSATSINAKVFGIGDKIGRLQKGLLADMIAVDGNPLEDISVMRKIVLVMKEGKIYLHP
ncbi:amidohydrolase family protein [Sediminibacterium sp.]|uniref:metal-dependent hydrolase family protein n=1 Tax=Sediminibacterium sp. TaxID=1917865 RepID=UPI0025DF50B9|nr:amidohydrolase family protein [Sediminibacterium sp.]